MTVYVTVTESLYVNINSLTVSLSVCVILYSVTVRINYSIPVCANISFLLNVSVTGTLPVTLTLVVLIKYLSQSVTQSVVSLFLNDPIFLNLS